jgi:GDPmannose 4,6-dehydratase
MFGGRSTVQNEGTAFIPNTPYGVAKAYAHRIVGVYRAQYGLHLSAGILFNHESPRRPLDFVSQKIAHGVASIALGLQQTPELDEHGRPILEAGRIHLGNIDIQRDFGFAGDYVEAMHAIVHNSAADDFVIGTGETHSIAEFCEVAFRVIGRDWREHVVSRPDLVRKTDDDTRGDPSKLKSLLGFSFKTTFPELVNMMVQARIELLQKSLGLQRNSSHES